VLNETPLIAVVDDDESVREATRGLLRSMGLTVEVFPSGEDFLNSPHLSRIACLVADINMPGMSGLDLHDHVSTLEKRIPTILMTAYPNDRNRKRSLAAGVRCYLVKPFNEDELLDCIRKALEQQEKRGSKQ
jgi:FixJ family two-component response regulator